MKNDDHTKGSNPESSDILRLARNGVSGERGILHVAFEPSEIPPLGPANPRANWLLPLTSPGLVRAAAGMQGNVYWMAPTRPEALAGGLVVDCEGVWWIGPAVALRMGSQMEIYSVDGSLGKPGSLPILATAFVLRWMGGSPSSVQAALRPAASPTFRSFLRWGSQDRLRQGLIPNLLPDAV